MVVRPKGAKIRKEIDAMGMLQTPTANASTFPVIWVWQEKAISKWCCATDAHCKAFAFHSVPKPAKGMGRRLHSTGRQNVV